MLTNPSNHNVLNLSGGVGGAKLALGLSKVLPPDRLSVVVNTADDFELFGLHISPDLDTLMYTLSEVSDNERGWGLADETWNMLESLGQLDGETWFQLGDRDLATHLLRTQYLREGFSLKEATSRLCDSLGVSHQMLPMTDDRVRTRVGTNKGVLDFQEYFVRDRCVPEIKDIFLDGIESALPQELFDLRLKAPNLTAIIIGPSNPFVSIDPIIKIPTVRSLMTKSQAPVIAVSPIIGKESVKGPAAKMMRELDISVSCKSIADYYGDLLDGFVIDEHDAHQAKKLQSGGLPVLVAQTLMRTIDDRIKLAEDILDFSLNLDQPKQMSS